MSSTPNNIPHLISYAKNIFIVVAAICGIIFALGAAYNRLATTEAANDKNSYELEQIKINQIRTAESAERLEKQQREVSEKMLSFIKEMSDRQQKTEERVTIAEYKLNSIEKIIEKKEKL